MESSLKFIQNKTVFLTFTIGSSLARAEVNIPFAVNRIIFRSLAYDGNVAEYGVLTSDLIAWNSVGLVYRDSTYSNSTAQTNEYHFQTPTKIQGVYTFRLQNLDGTEATVGGSQYCVFIAEFIRDKDGMSGHSH